MRIYCLILLSLRGGICGKVMAPEVARLLVKSHVLRRLTKLLAATQHGSCALCREQRQDRNEYHQYDPMINGVRLVASRVTDRHEYSQQDAHHCKGVGTDSYSPCPGLAGENGVGAHRQEEST